MGEILGKLSETQKKLLSWLAVLALIGVGFFLVQPAAPNPPEEPLDAPAFEGDSWEQRLAASLNSFLGAECSEVFLTLEGGSRVNIAYNTTEEQRFGAEGQLESRITSTPVVLRNEGERREAALVLEQIEPRVRGALIVLRTEPRADLRLAVAQAAATVLQAPMYRIEVLFKQ